MNKIMLNCVLFHTGFTGVGGFSGFGGFPILGGLVRGSGFGGRLKVGTCKFDYERRYEVHVI